MSRGRDGEDVLTDELRALYAADDPGNLNVPDLIRHARAQGKVRARRRRMTGLAAAVAAAAAATVPMTDVGLDRMRTERPERPFQATSPTAPLPDRFRIAVDQLGSTQLNVRLGGIYALEGVANDFPIQRKAIDDILTAFVREASAVNRAKQGSKAEPPLPVHGDVEAAVTVLGRLPTRPDRTLDLDGAYLVGADLGSAEFTYASLVEANLTDTSLSNAKLHLTNLTRANLAGAHLGSANLGGANLTGANLTDADLTEAYLGDANLTGANLTGANLARVDLTDANLTDANLTDTLNLPPGNKRN